MPAKKPIKPAPKLVRAAPEPLEEDPQIISPWGDVRQEEEPPPARFSGEWEAPDLTGKPAHLDYDVRYTPRQAYVSETPADRLTPGLPGASPAPTPTVYVGLIVHYVLLDGPNARQHRPGVVVMVHPEDDVTVNLQVLTDSETNRHQMPVGNDLLPAVMWKTNVKMDLTGAKGTWHFIES